MHDLGTEVGLQVSPSRVGPTVGDIVDVVGDDDGLIVFLLGALVGECVGGVTVGAFVGLVVAFVGDRDGDLVSSKAVGPLLGAYD